MAVAVLNDDDKKVINEIIDDHASSSFVGPITEETTLEQLGVDSLAFIEMVMELEEQLGLKIPDDIVKPAPATRVGELYIALAELKAK